MPLPAAFMAAERRPSTLEVITIDERLATAARRRVRCERDCSDRVDPVIDNQQERA
jgi:hypothetical protein